MIPRDELRALHRAEPLTEAELRVLTDDELRVLALDEALYGRDRLGDPTPPAIAEAMRRVAIAEAVRRGRAAA